MTAMTAARVHNTRPTPIVVAGVTIPAGRSAELDVDLEQLPAGAYVNPRTIAGATTDDPAAELDALKAGAADPAGYPAPVVIKAIAELDTAAAVTAIGELEARGKARSTVTAAVEARLADLATIPAPTDDEPPAVTLEEPTA